MTVSKWFLNGHLEILVVPLQSDNNLYYMSRSGSNFIKLRKILMNLQGDWVKRQFKRALP